MQPTANAAVQVRLSGAEFDSLENWRRAQEKIPPRSGHPRGHPSAREPRQRTSNRSRHRRHCGGRRAWKGAAAMRKRFSILVRDNGSGREIELCQVDSRLAAGAAGFASSHQESRSIGPALSYRRRAAEDRTPAGACTICPLPQSTTAIPDAVVRLPPPQPASQFLTHTKSGRARNAALASVGAQSVGGRPQVQRCLARCRLSQAQAGPSPPSQSLRCCRLPQKDRGWVFSW
jgi:hypothetical protein